MLKKVELDEIELYLSILQKEQSDLIVGLNYASIAKLIQVNFEVECTEQEIFLLYEPTIEEQMLDLQLLYNNLNLI